MAKVVIFNKPCRVLSQFREHENKTTLATYIDDSSLRLAGRLDYESEGLLILSADGQLTNQIADPKYRKPKTYLAQVEGEIDAPALAALAKGVQLKDGKTRPAEVQRIDEPAMLWPRNPPIRYRAHIPTSWVQLVITEGRNRQVRRMTAAVGFPTLRLIRWAVGDWTLNNIKPGELQVCHT